ncbi:MAG: hypothetical protein WCD37_16720 [Chloroflexia bacterium]
MFSNMYAIYQIARDIDRERTKDAKVSRLLSKVRKATQKRDR